MDPQVWAAFAAASLAVLAVPGPIVLMVVAAVLARGPRAALPLAVGTVLGDATLMTLALLGAGTLLAAEPALFAALRWIGAAYLAALGVATWRAGAGRGPARGPVAGSRLRLVGQAWLAVVLNPLSVGFFLAFLPQFVDPGRPFWPQVLVLEATFMALAFANALACGLLAARLGRAVAARPPGPGPGAGAVAGRIGGAALVTLGLWTALLAT